MPTARLPLVGRRDEMTALEDEFARAAAGEFRVVLLSGEAGVGKSRLGRELLARHPEAAGMFARAHPLGVTAAFGVWTEAIDPLLRGRPDPQVTATCGGLLDDLASLFHRVAVIRGSLPDREPPLPRLLQGLAAMLRNLARQAPVIAVLDDVHFADASSWEALRYFARHLDDTRLLVVATGRSGDLAGQEVAAQALFELDEDGFLRRLEVIPLDRHTTRELSETIIGQPPPAALVDWVGQRARGNPLYVISLVRALLCHLADPRQAVRAMAAAVRPGGWLLVEDADYVSLVAADPAHPRSARFDAVLHELLDFFAASRTFDPFFGRRLPSLVAAAGLTDAEHEGVACHRRGRSAAAELLGRSLQRTRAAAQRRGIVGADDFAAVLAAVADPSFSFVDALSIAAWGRNPG